MNHDNQKDVQFLTSSTSDSTTKRELTDGEIISVVGGFLSVGPNPPHLPVNPPKAT